MLNSEAKPETVDATSVEDLIQAAEAGILSEDWSTAAELYDRLYDRLRDLQPEGEVSHIYGGWALWKAGRHAEAHVVLRNAMVLWPKSEWAAIHYAWSAKDRFDWPEAAKRYARVRETFPDNVAGWRDGGSALLEAGQAELADDVLRQGVERFPDDKMLWFHYVRSASALDDWQAAVDRGNFLRTLCPDDPFWIDTLSLVPAPLVEPGPKPPQSELPMVEDFKRLTPIGLIHWIRTLRTLIGMASAGGQEKRALLICSFVQFCAAVTAATELGAEAGDADAVVTAVCHLLELAPTEVPDELAFRLALLPSLQWFGADFNRPANLLRDPTRNFICRWSAAEDPAIDILADVGDFHNFSIFRFEPSPVQQCRLALPAMAALGTAMSRSTRIKGDPLEVIEPVGPLVHVGFMAMGADPADHLTIALRHLAPALLTKPQRFRLTVFAWGNIAPEFLEWLRGQGAICHDVSWRCYANVTQQVEAIESIARQDPLAVLISDLNYVLPTAIFARRIAPAQVFLQGGMPAWPVPNLDAVFNSFGSDPMLAGWGAARIMDFATPWELAALNPPERPEEIAVERMLMPRGLRLIGNYGRLMKVTHPFLISVERILKACPDVAFVVGGSGDSEAIRSFIANSPVGARMYLMDRYVPGHSWGRLLELFLDTWPLTGAESVRETMAKGCPVIAMHSDEMPALDRQRDPELLAQDWDDYVDYAVRLMRDSTALSEAKQRAAEFAARMSDPAPFQSSLEASIESLLEDCRLSRCGYDRRNDA